MIAAEQRKHQYRVVNERHVPQGYKNLVQRQNIVLCFQNTHHERGGCYAEPTILDAAIIHISDVVKSRNNVNTTVKEQH